MQKPEKLNGDIMELFGGFPLAEFDDKWLAFEQIGFRVKIDLSRRSE